MHKTANDDGKGLQRIAVHLRNCMHTGMHICMHACMNDYTKAAMWDAILSESSSLGACDCLLSQRADLFWLLQKRQASCLRQGSLAKNMLAHKVTHRISTMRSK